MTNPTLDDDRIDRMRLGVMHRVDADVRHRGRRVRRTVGLAAAGVVVIGLGGYATSLVTDDNVSVTATSTSDSGGRSDAAAPGELENGKVVPDASRQVVTTGTISVTVERPSDTAQRLSVWVESIGGRIDDRSESGSGDAASASLTVRVPSDQVTATIDRLRNDGTVEDVALQNSDVTAQATDLDARIDALQLSIGRLERIMGASGTSAELIKAERALTERQEQLESLQAQRKGLRDQVSLSTLTIGLAQEPQVGSVEPGGFGGGLRDGWNALVSSLNVGVEIAGRLLPWAALAAAAAALVSLVRRSTRRLRSGT